VLIKYVCIRLVIADIDQVNVLHVCSYVCEYCSCDSSVGHAIVYAVIALSGALTGS
jgi:hypothetical protein